MVSPDLLEIILGYKTVEFNNVLYDVYFPTLKIIHNASFYARKSRNDLKGTVFDNIDIDVRKETLLSKEEIELLESFDLKLADFKRDLEIQTNAGKRVMIRNRIKKLEEDREKVEITWNRIKLMTSDGYIHLITTQVCFCTCVRYHETGEPVWDNYEEFLDDNHGVLIQALLKEYVDLTNKYSDKKLRELAKENYYRVIYQIMKENQISFCSSMVEMSMVAIRLLYWISYYTNIIQNAQEECPSEILNDDDSFDNWANRVRKGITPELESNSQGKYKVKGKHRETIVINN